MKTPHPIRRVLAPGIFTLAFIFHPTPFIIAAEPTRQELWVPTKNLDTVLEEHPNAVMLSPEQYETLIRDAGKTQAAEDPKLTPPKIIAIEGLRLEGKADAVSTPIGLLPTKGMSTPKHHDQHQQGHQLGGKCLGRGNPHLRTRPGHQMKIRAPHHGAFRNITNGER